MLAQVKNYEQFGFRLAHYHVRYSGIGNGNRPEGLIPIADVPLAAIRDYDAKCFPAPREAFLKAWIQLPESIALAATAQGGIAGYGVLRRSADGYKVGPLFADDPDTATRLLAGLLSEIPGRPYCIDMPESSVQPGTLLMATAFGLTEVFRTARMYTGGEPSFDGSRVFGVTTLELG